MRFLILLILILFSSQLYSQEYGGVYPNLNRYALKAKGGENIPPLATYDPVTDTYQLISSTKIGDKYYLLVAVPGDISTSAKQDSLLARIALLEGILAGIGTNQLPDGHNVTVDNTSIPVTGTFWQTTQPVVGSFYQTLIDNLYGTITLTNDSTAYQFSELIGDTLDVVSIKITNKTSGAIVSLGNDSLLTIDNGTETMLYYWDGIWNCESTDDLWLVTNVPITIVSYKITIRRQ